MCSEQKSTSDPHHSVDVKDPHGANQKSKKTGKQVQFLVLVSLKNDPTPTEMPPEIGPVA